MNHNCTFFLLFAFAGMLLNACKKDNTKPGQSIDLEQLGDFKPSPYSSVGFNFAGDPVIQSEGVIYEWKPTEKNWIKLADAIPATIDFGYLLQDKQGEYYGGTSNSLFKLDKTTLLWDTLRLENYATSISRPIMLTNEMGDMVARISDGENFYYFKKQADATTWTKFKEQAPAQEGDATPYFLTNSGLIYYSYPNLPPYPFGRLHEKTMNFNSGVTGKLFVKSELENAGIQVEYNIDNQNDPSMCIDADGKVYILNRLNGTTDKCILYTLTPPVIPAPLVTAQIFNIPTVKEATDDWTTEVVFVPFSVDDAGNLKLMLLNSKLDQSDAYWAGATARIGSPDIHSDGEHINQNEIHQNLQGDTYLFAYFDYFYKWE